MAGPSAATHLMKEDPRPPVLYLRSFKADHKEGTPRWLQAETQEEKITSVFSRIGPPVALGDPKEKGKFPTLGIPRDYVEGSWEKIVENLLARARLVVVRAGTTTSLIDEVSWAKRALKPERLLIIVPSGRKNYEAFRSRVKDYAHRPLPEYPSWQTSRTRIKGLICFEPDGTARFLTFKWSFLRGSVLNPLPRALQATLRPVYERLGIPWRPSSINWVRVLLLGLLVLTLLYVLNEKIRSYPI
jgi:hypothetical protein